MNGAHREFEAVAARPTSKSQSIMASPMRYAAPCVFTPQGIKNITDFVAEGISRDEIANRLGVTVASLQVTCSRLGISLRRIILPNGSRRHTADVRPSSVGIAHVREQELGKFEIVMRCHGIEQTSDIPLSLAAIEVLALEAMSRDLGIADLIGQSLVA